MPLPTPFSGALSSSATLWDTANVYGDGTSEEIVRRAVRRYTSRDEVVIATKVGLAMHDGPTGSGDLHRPPLASPTRPSPGT